MPLAEKHFQAWLAERVEAFGWNVAREVWLPNHGGRIDLLATPPQDFADLMPVLIIECKVDGFLNAIGQVLDYHRKNGAKGLPCLAVPGFMPANVLALCYRVRIWPMQFPELAEGGEFAQLQLAA